MATAGRSRLLQRRRVEKLEAGAEGTTGLVGLLALLWLWPSLSGWPSFVRFFLRNDPNEGIRFRLWCFAEREAGSREWNWGLD